MSMNVKLGIASSVMIIFVVFILYIRAKTKKQIYMEEDLATFDQILEALKLYIVSLVKEKSISSSDTDEELDRQAKRKAQLKEALKNAVFGIDSAKLLVKNTIRNFLTTHVAADKLREIMGLDNDSEPSTNIMFEVIMYKYKEIYGRDALNKWIIENKYHLPRKAVGMAREGDKAYYITKADLEESYFKLDYRLSDDEIYDIFTTLLYQSYKGFGCIDTLAEMNINGYNLGVSGSVMNAIDNNNEEKDKSDADAISEISNAIWIYFKGSYMHLQFLTFDSEDEIKRIIQLIIRWNSPGPLTAKRGFMVNTMADKSRVLAIRPPAGETWSAFVRKFSLDIISPEALIVKKGVTNGEVAVKLIEYMMRGQTTTAVTGRQGAGKTTFLKAIVAYIDPQYNIRVLEMAPELYLRELYNNRNIYSVQETDTCSAESLQDALKKSDGGVTIIGEVATDPVAARMVQLCMTGSLYTLFTHHANEPKDLVLTLRNSLVNAGGFDNMSTAEKQVTDVLKANIHLDLTTDNKRYIKRITEIIQLEEGIAYPDYDEEAGYERSKYELDKEYDTRQTDRLSFTSQDILTYDTETDTYKPGADFSDKLKEKIRSNLSKEDREEFDKFIAYYWHNESVDGYTGVAKINPFDEAKDTQKEYAEQYNIVDDDFTAAIDFLTNRSAVADQFNLGQ